MIKSTIYTCLVLSGGYFGRFVCDVENQPIYARFLMEELYLDEAITRGCM